MRAGRYRRAAGATGLSLVLHVLALTGMVVGLKLATPPPEDRAIEVRLMPPLKLQPPPQPARRQAERAGPATALRPRPTPPPPGAPALARPETAAPAAAPEAVAGTGLGPNGLAPSLSGRLGCDNALGAHLTPEQRQACEDNLVREALKAPQLGLNIPDVKKAQYDTHIRCRDEYRKSLSMNIPKGCLGFGK